MKHQHHDGGVCGPQKTPVEKEKVTDPERNCQRNYYLIHYWRKYEQNYQKSWIFCENQKWRKSKMVNLGFVKMVFGGSTDVSLKSSGHRSTAADEIYTLVVLKSWCSCWIDVKCNARVLLFLHWFLCGLVVTKKM